MTTHFQPTGGEATIELRELPITTGFSRGLATTALPDGRIAAVWDSASNGGIWAALLNPDGTIIGAPFRVNTGEDTAGGRIESEWEPSVTARADGGFMVAWTAEIYNSGYNTGRDINARQYDASGTPLDDPYAAVYRVVQQSAGPYVVTSSWELHADLTTLADGRIAMVYDAAGETILRLYEADGITPVGAAIHLDIVQASGYHSYPVVAGLAGGGYVAAWQGPDGDGSGIRASVFAQDGTLLRSDFVVNGDTAYTQQSARIVALDDGGFLVAWYRNYDPDAEAWRYEVRGHLFDAEGRPVGGEFGITEAFQSYAGIVECDIAAAPDGGFVAAFRADSGVEAEDDIYLQRLDAEGRTLGGAVIANAVSPQDQYRPQVEVSDDGLVTVVWTSEVGDDYAIASRAFRLAEIDGTPTEGSDFIASSDAGGVFDLLDGDDLFEGGAGDDSATGGAGADTLNGDSGDDVLSGDDGADALDGGAGGDRLDGGAGDDTISGDVGNDGLIGRDGDDVLSGGDGDDTVAAGVGDDTVAGGDGDDFIGGGEGDDVITDTAGNDTVGAGFGNDLVDAGEGDDVVAGGPGDDTLDGGPGNDVMGGSFGDDSVTGGAGDDDLGGGTGADTIDAGDGNDSVGGGEGDDSILGGLGDDFLAGGGRDDTIDGGQGNDTINAGTGNDVITGAEGADVFVFNTLVAGETDVIADFHTAEVIRIAGVDNAPGSGLQGYLDALDPTQVGADAHLSHAGHTIVLQGYDASMLALDDFIFA